MPSRLSSWRWQSWSASCCAWCLPAVRRWPSIGWPIGASMPRTRAPRMRHLPAGLVERGQRDGVCRGCAAGFVAATLLFLPNRLAAVSCRCPSWRFCWAIATRNVSRRSRISGWERRSMLAPVAAWIAVRGELAWPPVVLGGAVLLVGGRLRHHLRLPGRRVRSQPRAAQRARSPGRAGGAAAGRGLPPGHRGPVVPAPGGLSAAGRHLPGGHRGRGRCC